MVNKPDVPMFYEYEYRYEWLIENGFKSREDYLESLKKIKKEINKMVRMGYLKETTPKDECRPDNPHHYHTYEVIPNGPKSLNGLELTATLSNPLEPADTATIYEASLIGVTQISLGHPCALVFARNAVGKVLDIVPSTIKTFSINKLDKSVLL